MKRLGLIFCMMLLPLLTQAAQCTQFLEASPKIDILQIATLKQLDAYFNGQQSSRFIGLSVKDSRGEIHTVLGPIVGSSHSRLLDTVETLASQSRGTSVTEILWAGEIHLLPVGRKFQVLEVNETAGLNQQLQSGNLPFINSSKVENIVSTLSSSSSLFTFSRSQTQVRKFNSEDTLNNHVLEFVSAKDFRHELGNSFNVLSFVEMINSGFKLKTMTREDVVSLKANFISIVDFIKVFQQEVHIGLPMQNRNDLLRLSQYELQIRRVETVEEFQTFVKSSPGILNSLKSAFEVFSGNLTMNSLVVISNVN